MNRKLNLLFILVLIFQSCDPGYDAKIINDTNKPIEVIFEYDKNIILENLERKINFMPEVVLNNENTRTLFDIDTTNFIVTSIVQSKDTLILEMGLGTRPDFRNINRIKIFGTDTVNLRNNDKIIKVFTQHERNQYELVIK